MPDAQNLLIAAQSLKAVIPKAYDDVVHPFAKETGEFLARVPKAINAALSGIDVWIEERKYAVSETKKMLAKKLKNVDPAKIVPPEPYIAVPAMQAISYSMNSHELREMYANLLAKSMNFDTKENVHPSFVEIIKQMSPLDSIVMKEIASNVIAPMISLRITKEDSDAGADMIRHITWMNFADTIKISSSLDNLKKCGLIELKDESHYTDESNYDKIKNSHHFQALKNSVKPTADFPVVQEVQQLITVTDFGKLFYEICISTD